jgi:soluble lytic murein transglycosylase-like protein
MTFAISIFCENAYADNFYKYTDENSKVWFSNSCPSERKCTLVLKGSGKKSGASKIVSQGSKTKKNSKNEKIPAGSEERMELYESYILDAAEKYHLPANLIRAVMKVESNFHPFAISWAGAQGLMQLMPGTAAFLNVFDPFDPKENIFGGAKYLRILADKFDGDMIKTLSGYHAGEGAVVRADGVPTRVTADYVLMVLRHYKKFKELFPEEVKK